MRWDRNWKALEVHWLKNPIQSRSARLIFASPAFRDLVAAMKTALSPRALTAIGAIVLILTMAATIGLVRHAGATWGMSHFIFTHVDIPGFAASAAGLALVFLLARRAAWADLLLRLNPLTVSATALIAGVLSTHFVHHAYAFSMDEWMMRFQAEVFLNGDFAGRIAPEWRGYERAIFHSFATIDEAGGLVASSYRPGMAALIALLDLAGLGLYVSAALTAGAVWLTASIARKIWPDDVSAPIVAALLVATSSQALAAAGTSYAMAGHLFFNLLWLRLFLSDRLAANLIAPFAGLAAASLHQVHVHAFFAAPFYLMLLRPFRPGLILWCGAVYLAGHLAIIGWDDLAFGAAGSGATEGGAERTLNVLDRIARLPAPHEAATVIANLGRLIGWQSLALGPLLVAWAFWGRKRGLPALLVASLAFSLIPYFILMPDQGHGWGYRYLHSHIGALALLGAAGWVAMQDAHLRRAVLVCIAATLVTAIPFRAVKIAEIVAPWAKATAAFEATDADVVVVDSLDVFYGQDIVRTGPYAQGRPVGAHLHRISLDDLRRLCAEKQVAYFGPDHARANGVPLINRAEGEYPPDYRAKQALLTGDGCG